MKYCSYCMNQMDENDVVCPLCGGQQNAAIPGHHILPGTVLNNKYYVGASIGEGGFGITYIGRDTNLDMKVAIKEYYPNGYATRTNTVALSVNSMTDAKRREVFEQGKERFLREARILAKFSGSPGIVDVRDFFEENNTAYIVMEYLEGETLKKTLMLNGNMTPESAVNLLMPVMTSLKKVHQQGLIHRDISPDNIMLVDDQVKLLDFGAARNVTGDGNKSLSVMLKPGYAPEEQYRSRGEQGPWTDIYALCATLYKCITGIIPDDATQRVYNDELRAPSALGLSIDPNIEYAIMKGLSVFKRDRFQSIDELLDGFNGIGIDRNPDENRIPDGRTGYNDGSETIYIESDSGTVSEDGYVTGGVSGYDPVTGNGPVDPVRFGDDAKNVTGSSSGKNNKKTDRAGTKKNRNPKKIGMILLSAALIVAVIVGITTIFKVLGTKTIAGEKVSKDATVLSLHDKDLTVDDAKEILKLGKLENLSLYNCRLNDEVLTYFANISTYLQTLVIGNCSGIGSFGFISNYKYLTSLTIANSGLTNDELEGIDFGNKDYLTRVSFAGNKQLTNIKKLAYIEDTLTELNVDGTGVSDFSDLADCSLLYKVSAQNCGLTSLSSLTNNTIVYLYVNDNQISDISAVSDYEYLRNFEANNNVISDISALAGHKALYDVRISDNQVDSLLALADCGELQYLYANRNNLTSLDGLQKCLQLKVIQVEDNDISDLDGIVNCTVIEQINLNGNHISDISILTKSSKTLKNVYLSKNNISDISALQGTSSLTYLNLDFNSVESLDPLTDSVSLIGISAEGNRITSVDGLKNAAGLKYIYLPHNNISGTLPFITLTAKAEDAVLVLDLSSNNITELLLPDGKKITYLSVYNNPIKSYWAISKVSGTYFLFSYIDGEDYSSFRDSYDFYKVIDCPLDQQIAVRDALGSQRTSMKVRFQSIEEADQETEDAKSALLTGSTKEESDSTEE